ncbi:MAG: 4Fe-4S binding protein, partial [Alphaproteobacteria bacterium]
HCGLCAERCPTGAWDMQKFTYVERHANLAGQGHCMAYIS